MQTAMGNARCAGWMHTSFIPNDEFNKMLTRETISEVISSVLNLAEPDVELPALVDNIDPRDPRDSKTSRKRIFAILTMLDVTDSIVHFIDAGIYDKHLPFEKDKPSGDNQVRYIGDDGSEAVCPIQCFDNSHAVAHTFRILQWEYLAPSFSFGQGEVHHHEIQFPTPLPFIEGDSVPIVGGNSQVSRVVMHPSHHDLTDGCEFAVKRLSSSTNDEFEREVEALKRVRQLNHPHLVKLLGTYKYQEFYYLIFRWATDDLKTFWRNNPSPDSVSSMSIWALEQCLGIAQGLQLIHNDHHSPRNQSGVKGRHGDIKPANILRYAPIPGSQDPAWGVLKISDFGLARFHPNDSYKRQYRNGLVATYAYRSPEADLGGEISYLWDIWPLGCLYLEFITWILRGSNGITAFSEERKDEDESHSLNAYEADSFFKMDNTKTFRACLKDSVRRHIDELHGHPECTGLIHDFLALISEDLMRVRAKKRAKCNQIVKRLELMKSKCEDTQDYYTKPQKRLVKRATNKSDKSRTYAVPVSNRDSEKAIEESSVSSFGNRSRWGKGFGGFLYFIGSGFGNSNKNLDSGKE
ncbi:kinase-like protein [Nemania sp. NC0429]|nr:kinase-like protein [Nemania sp. NC0429]